MHSNGFQVYMKYRIELGRKIWKKKCRKAHILGKIRAHVLVHVMLCFPVSISFCIAAITCSFIIRFEWLKWLIKIDFKENQIYTEIGIIKL